MDYTDNILDMTTALNKKGQQGFELVQVIFERDAKQFLFKKQIWNESDKLYSNGVCLNKSLSVLFMCSKVIVYLVLSQFFFDMIPFKYISLWFAASIAWLAFS